MNAVVFKHVPVAELPPAWRGRRNYFRAIDLTIDIALCDSSFVTPSCCACR
ncbi:hypothetical protein J2W96_003166 [Variovorax guangxiensis]|nr:hypothetical protein [Variovorax guangxiensis]